MCHARWMLPFLRPRLKAVDQALQRVERGVALITRSCPRNNQAEQARLLAAWSAGRREAPRWSYAPIPDLSELRRALGAAAQLLESGDGLSDLYLARVQELELETRIVEALGRREFCDLAASRFEVIGDSVAAEARTLSETWSRLNIDEGSDWIATDDRGDPRSLVCRLGQLLGKLKLPVRVEVSDELVAAAATGQACIFVSSRRRLTPEATERIVLHEVLGHAAPRHAALRQSLGLFATGSARGNDEQEGYALFLEEQSDLMDDARRRELGLRHLAAVATQAGADWSQVMDVLMGQGAPLTLAVTIASRVQRGGGLAREAVYLPALCRVRRAVAADPSVQPWLASGRLSLPAIASLRSLGVELQ